MVSFNTDHTVAWIKSNAPDYVIVWGPNTDGSMTIYRNKHSITTTSINAGYDNYLICERSYGFCSNKRLWGTLIKGTLTKACRTPYIYYNIYLCIGRVVPHDNIYNCHRHNIINGVE